MKSAPKGDGVYWVIVFLASCLLLWAWSVAVRNLINGTTVVS